MKKDKKLTRIFTIFIICIGLFFLVFMLKESDYYWHIKAGEYMFKHGIITKDVFSWSVAGKYWTSHEWLFEIILYLLKLISPNGHLIIYGGLFIISLLLILFLGNKNEYLKNPYFSIIWIILSCIFIPYMQARPHLISFNLLTLTFWFLYDLYKNEDSKKIYFLPIITILWANIHGGSSNLSYLLCFVFLICGLFNYNSSKISFKKNSKKQFYKYLLVGLLCILCITFNIHGIKMLLYPYQNMMDKVMLSNILEWFPTNLNDPTHYTYLFFVVFIFFIMMLSKKKIDFIDLIVFGICLFLGFKSVRFWGYTYIFMNFIIFKYINKSDYGKEIFLMMGICIVFFISVTLLSKDRTVSRLNNSSLDKDLVELIKHEKPKRLFNVYDFGGELIYNDIKVFVDGRADLYSKYNFKEYLVMADFNTGVLDFIEKYDFDYYLVSNNFSITNYLKANDKYISLYSRDGIYLFKKV